MSRTPILLAWSSGKDSAWALHALRRSSDLEVVGLLTTISSPYARVSMHAVRREVVEAQADAVGLPLWTVEIPSPCSANEYEGAMRNAMERARAEGISGVAFGDLHLADVRDSEVPFCQRQGLPVDVLDRRQDDVGSLAVDAQATGKRHGREHVCGVYEAVGHELLESTPSRRGITAYAQMVPFKETVAVGVDQRSRTGDGEKRYPQLRFFQLPSV